MEKIKDKTRNRAESIYQAKQVFAGIDIWTNQRNGGSYQRYLDSNNSDAKQKISISNLMFEILGEIQSYKILLNSENNSIDGKSGSDWAAQQTQKLAEMENVHVLNRTTVFGYYDHNTLGAIEKVSDHVAQPAAGKPRQRM